MKIQDLTTGERPRERLLERGAAALSDGELLAILVRTGSRGCSAPEIARKLLSVAGGRLSSLFSMSVGELVEVEGIGNDKACTLLAAAELGRRFMSEGAGMEKKPVVSARMVYELMKPLLKGLDHEEFWVLYLNSARYLLGKEKVSVGNGRSTSFDIRRVVKNTLDRRAFALVIVHNHPSGNPSPSQADIRQTKTLGDACSHFDIALEDHVVICDDCFFSFAEDRRYPG